LSTVLVVVATRQRLKENAIVGRLIPAGTGAVMSLLREVAVRRDALILEQRERTAAAAAEQQPTRLPAAEERGRLPRVRSQKGRPRAPLFISVYPIHGLL